MSQQYTMTIPAHPNIYTGQNERLYRIDYVIPEAGTNEQTGLLVLVPGFGAHIDSNIYIKMRNQLADVYNLVVLQCDYFGSRFMQNEYPVNYADARLVEQYDMNTFKLEGVAILEENASEFVDMGYMQAIDIITAIEVVQLILKENGLPFNEDKILGMGHSQGAYLLHLVNRLSPSLLTAILDNSAWVEPVYLHRARMCYDNVAGIVHFYYIVQGFLEDKQALSLNELYKGFHNGAYIYSVIGTTDNLVSVEEKRAVMEKLDYVEFEVIDINKVDGVVFKSTNHGLDADFLALFALFMQRLPKYHRNINKKKLHYTVESSQTTLQVDYTTSLPLFSFKA